MRGRLHPASPVEGATQAPAFRLRRIRAPPVNRFDTRRFYVILVYMKPLYLIGIFVLFGLTINGCAGRHPSSDFSSLEERPTPAPKPAQEKVIRTARAFIGTPYRFGGTTPKGFDCSGFITYVFRRAVGLTLPRTTQDIVERGSSITVSELKPADLVYFEIDGPAQLHIGIYLGKGKFIHAPRSKGRVNIQDLRLDYWRSRYIGARRILSEPL
ncbi:MAG: C40 family peptidase [Candidatus Manganitrophaceae bacterium]